MAKVGQPLLPSKPKNIKTSSSFPTDSESEDDPSFHHRYRSKNGFQSPRSSPSSSTEEPQPSSKKLTSQNVSTSSSVEEINTRRSKMTEGVGSSISDIPFHNVNQIPYYATGRQQQNIPSGVPQGAFQPSLQGTVIAYQPQPVFQQPQQQLQNPPVHSSDPLLSLMFAESRSQNTDLRVALSQLTQKIDLVYSKIDAMDHQGTSSLVTTGNSNTYSSDYDPQEFLKQITTMVEQLQSYKEKVAIKNERLEQLSQDYTQVLKKNQMLLEEKAELLSLKSEAFENKRESEMRMREMKLIEEQRISLEKELEHIKKDTEEKMNLSEELESRIATIQEEYKKLKLENTIINDELVQLKETKNKLYDENQSFRLEILEIRKETEETNEKLVQIYTEKLKNIEIENSNLKDEIKAKNIVELDLKDNLELQEQIIIMLKKELEVVKKKDFETKSGKEKELECQLEKELNINVEKDIQLKSKIELISQLESKLMKLQEEKVHPERTSSATNTEIDSSGLSRIENDHKKIDVESVGKDIMNTAYRILKKGLSSKEMYNKQSVLDSVVDAFRETILKYTEEVESENAKVIPEVKNVNQSREIISSMEENVTTKKRIENQLEAETVNQYPEADVVEEHLTASNTNNDKVTKVVADYLENNSVAKSQPATNPSAELPENEKNLVEKSKRVEPENSVKISSPAFSGEINTVLSDVEKSEPPSDIVEETPKPERKKVLSDVPKENISETPTSNLSNEIKDDEDLTWKTGPPPPPPPLFSDSEDNDD
ncbi:FK506-binding protein 15, partial [Armadillidium nasatum]